MADLQLHTFTYSLRRKNEQNLIASLEIMAASLSSYRNSHLSCSQVEHLHCYLKQFNEVWLEALATPNLPHLVLAALVQCLSKTIKISKLTGYGHLRKDYCLHLSGDISHLALRDGSTMLWRRYLHACCLMICVRDGKKPVNHGSDGAYTAFNLWVVESLCKNLLE